jgi:thiol-disulfide isomerase/thioredoxin
MSTTKSRAASQAPTGKVPPRPTGAARRRAEAQRRSRKRRRDRALLGGGVAAVLAIVGLVVGLHVASSNAGTSSAATLPAGSMAPDAAFTTLAGKTETLSALRGRPTLLWLVTTWCSSCQAGTPVMAQNIPKLAADGVRVVELENYQDLGQSGPSMSAFSRALAGAAISNPDWIFGEASAELTRAYNPKAYLDIYYLINAQGRITYVNSSPASTMPQLLKAAEVLA